MVPKRKLLGPSEENCWLQKDKIKIFSEETNHLFNQKIIIVMVLLSKNYLASE